MKKLLLILTGILIISCKNQPEQKTEPNKTKIILKEETNTPIKTIDVEDIDSKLSNCEKYWMYKFPKDSIKTNILME